jgi:RNA polymerase sigma factor (sigma-70 family)
MAAGQLNQVVRRLREVTSAGRADADLLKAFVQSGDERAFEVLVRRHGPVVLGVCRRVLRNGADAEDCFQATFLILVRKARSIGRPESLGSWLYGVACRVAQKARIEATRRRAKEALVMRRAETAGGPTDDDLLAALDQELAGLPEKYRVPLVRCDLGGKTRREVAREIGCAEGTVASRLARGRVLLARRLSRKGFTLSGGALAAVLSASTASASVPASLVGATVRAAVLYAAGKAVAATVTALTEGVLKAMLLNKLKAGAAVLMTLGLLATVAGAVAVQPAPSADNSPLAHQADPRKAVTVEARLSDAEFIRRACLDIRGSLPTDIEVHYFLGDSNPKKRAWLIGRLREEAARRAEGRKASQPDPDLTPDDLPRSPARQNEVELRKLTGAWQAARMVLNGSEVRPSQLQAKLVFRAGHLTFFVRRPGQDEKHTSEFTVRVSSSRMPKHIDLTPLDGQHKGQPLLGIYEVTGDTLRLRFASRPSEARPTEFGAAPGSNGYLIAARQSGFGEE